MGKSGEKPDKDQLNKVKKLIEEYIGPKKNGIEDSLIKKRKRGRRRNSSIQREKEDRKRKRVEERQRILDKERKWREGSSPDNDSSS